MPLSLTCHHSHYRGRNVVKDVEGQRTPGVFNPLRVPFDPVSVHSLISFTGTSPTTVLVHTPHGTSRPTRPTTTKHTHTVHVDTHGHRPRPGDPLGLQFLGPPHPSSPDDPWDVLTSGENLIRGVEQDGTRKVSILHPLRHHTDDIQ